MPQSHTVEGATINNESATIETWLRTDSSRSHMMGELKFILLAKSSPPDSAVVKTQNFFSSSGGILNYLIFSHRETSKNCIAKQGPNTKALTK